MTDEMRKIGIANQCRRNATINNVIEMLQTDMDIESNTAEHKSAAKIAILALEIYTEKMNKALDMEYGKDVKALYVPIAYTALGEREGKPCSSYSDAEAGVRGLKAAYSDIFKFARIIKRYE